MLNERQPDGPIRSGLREATDVLIVGGGVIGFTNFHGPESGVRDGFGNS